MRILFIGNMKSPFIRQDFELLSNMYDVELFDLGLHATRFSQMFQYQVKVLGQINAVRRSNVLWIWYVDYPAVPFIILAKVLGKPVVVNVGGWEVYNAPEINYGAQRQLVRGAVARWILRVCDRAIVPSKAYLEITKRVVPTCKASVVPIPVGVESIGEHLPEKNGVVTALCPLASVKLKGIDVFEKIQKTTLYPTMVINNVPHERLIQWFKESKVYCQLSYTESFGVSLLEAMACGCVPVVSDRDALPEVVGDTGIVVPYGDVEATTTAIGRALTMDGTPARLRAATFTKSAKRECIDRLLRRIVK